jgi:hypothetical protein
MKKEQRSSALEYYYSNRERILEYRKRYYEKNKEKILSYNKEYHKSYVKKKKYYQPKTIVSKDTYFRKDLINTTISF